MNQQVLGDELKTQLKIGFDVVRISRWAFQIYSENIRDLDPDMRGILEHLFSMEEGPQFEYTEHDLKLLAEKLIQAEEREALEFPDFLIAHKAIILNETWLMCPLCQEAWESISTYGMVVCPKCNERLHNPYYA